MACYGIARRIRPDDPPPLHIPARLWLPLAVAASYAGSPGLLARCVTLSVVNHALVCNSSLVAAALLGGVPVGVLEQFLLNPLAMAMNILPFTPGGVGLAETAFSYLYEVVGVQGGAAFGLLGRIILYAAYTLVGVPCLVRLPRAHRSAADGTQDAQPLGDAPARTVPARRT